MTTHANTAILIAALAVGTQAHAQTSGKDKKQAVKPPLAQVWIDVATSAGMAIPGMGAGGANPMAMLGGLFGGGGRNAFGNTAAGPEGNWLDVTLATRINPNLESATQAVPAGSKLAPELALTAPRQKISTPRGDDEEVVKENFEPPKGKIYLYWGCGDTVRPGQPKVLDMSRASMEDFQKFFVSRRATQRGAHLSPGRPAWPNEDDARLVPAGSSLVGAHAFKGRGVPESFKFSLGSQQDFMPRIELTQRETGGASQLEWKPIATSRAYFLNAMGARGGNGNDNEMVFWSSSDVPEIGTGLVDYQTNPAIDRWLKEKVLLGPDTRACAVPKGIFGEGAMLRMIAYGNELNLAHPPRPSDPRIAWDPEWTAKVRVKSVTTAMLGMEAAMRTGASGREDTGGRDFTSRAAAGGGEDRGSGGGDAIGQGLNKLKGLFGF